MNITRQMNASHVLFHLVYQMLGGIIYAFGIYMLIERGYTNAEAGVCFAFVNIFSLFVISFISNYIDNNEKHSIFDVIAILTIICIVIILINYFLFEKSLILSIVFIIGNGVGVVLDPIINSISSKLKNYNINIPYSSARAIASASYGITCIIFGFISQKYSYRSVVLGGVIFSFILLIIAVYARHVFNTAKESIIKLKKDDVDKISMIDFCKNNVLFIVTCFFMVLIYVGFSTADNFMLLVCENVGGNSKDMGYILGFKAFIEVIPIFTFPYIIKKFKFNNVLYVSALSFIIKCLIIYFAPNVFWLYIAQIFQGFSFALMLPGMVEYVNRFLKGREVVRGISLSSLTLSIANVISSFMCGYIADLFSVNMMNLFALLITVVGAIGYSVAIFYRFKKVN